MHEEPSLLHAFFERTAPTELNLFNVPSINVPRDEYSRQSILESIRNSDEIQVHSIVSGSAIPIRSGDTQRDTEIESFTRQIAEKRLKLQTIKIEPEMKFEELSREQIENLKESFLHYDMCQKLAILGIDLLRNQAVTREIFARTQQSEDYFSVIYQSILDGQHDFLNFIIKNSVLYRKVYDNISIPRNS